MFDLSADAPARVRVKICGICNADDARAAVEFGADAIGLNTFRGSKRYLDLARAGQWISALPQTLRKIAITVDPTFEDAIAIARFPFITGLQLHGNETPEFCARLAHEGVRFAKAIPVRGETSLTDLPDYSTRWIVLDSAGDASFGGTGKTFPWDFARRF